MDHFLNKLDTLAALASGRADPVPLDAGRVMARVRGLEIEDEEVVPIRFFAGGAVAAAAAALALSPFALSAWDELSNPMAAMNSLLEVMDVML